MTRGVHIALMGIDGAGKTTLALLLAQRLESMGFSAEVVSWKQARKTDTPIGRVLCEMSAIIDATHHALGSRLAERSPSAETDATDRLAPQRPSGAGLRGGAQRARSSRFASAALLELSGSLIFHDEYIADRINAGKIVIDESYGHKHVLKNALLEKRCKSEGLNNSEASDEIISFSAELLARIAPPDFGYFLNTAPDLARKWRRAANIADSMFESYAILDRGKTDTFLQMQHDCVHWFRTAAEKWNWKTIETADRSLSENMEPAINAILADIRPTMQRSRAHP